MYEKSVNGARKHLIRSGPEGAYISDYPNHNPTMQHLACFAGGMLVYGASTPVNSSDTAKVA